MSITRLTVLFNADGYEETSVDELRTRWDFFGSAIGTYWDRVFSGGGMPAFDDLRPIAHRALQDARHNAKPGKAQIAYYCDY